MTAPRRPAAGRRPAASRGRAARTTRAGAARARTATSTTSTPPGRGGLTHRAAVLGLVVTTLVLSAALPVREFLDQRAAISALEKESSDARARVAELEAAKLQLQDPAYIAAEARRRLHMARPGEVAYVLLTPPPVPEEEADAPAPTAGGPDDPWWSQVWGSVETADRPPPPAEPAPAPVPLPAPPPAPEP